MPMHRTETLPERPIDGDAVFDQIVVVFAGGNATMVMARLFVGQPALLNGVLNEQVMVGHIHPRHFHDVSHSEIAEVLQRIDAESCKVWLYDSDAHRLIAEENAPAGFLDIQLQHPFHQHRELVALNMFFHNLRYRAATGNDAAYLESLLEIKEPSEGRPFTSGIKTIHRYKRGASATIAAPASRFTGDQSAFLTALTAEGWTEGIPSSGGARFAKQTIDYGFTSNGLPITALAGQTVYAETGAVFLDRREALRSAAFTYKAWEDSASDNDRKSNMMLHWRGWIGAAWEILEDETITTKAVSSDATSAVAPARTITGRDAVVAWYQDHIIAWAAEGFQAFYDRVTHQVTFGNRLEHPTLAKFSVAATPVVGEGLRDIVTADWNRHREVSYFAALGIDPPASP